MFLNFSKIFVDTINQEKGIKDLEIGRLGKLSLFPGMQSYYLQSHVTYLKLPQRSMSIYLNKVRNKEIEIPQAETQQKDSFKVAGKKYIEISFKEQNKNNPSKMKAKIKISDQKKKIPLANSQGIKFIDNQN